MKLCKDCKFYKEFNTCKKNVNLVDGGELTTWRRMASLQREDGWLTSRMTGTCGIKARWWEAKEEQEEQEERPRASM